MVETGANPALGPHYNQADSSGQWHYGTVSTKRFHSVGDLSRFGYKLSVECLSCGHGAELDPYELGRHCGYVGRKFLSDQLGPVVKRLRCSKCGGKRIEWGPRNRG